MKRSHQITLGIISLAALGGGLYIYRQKPRSSMGVSTPPLHQIQKTFMTQLTGHQNSPAGRAWKAQDFKALETMFDPKQSAKRNAEFFQISINVLDTQILSVKEEKQSAYSSLKTKIVDFILSKDEGVSPFALQFAFKTLGKLSALESADLSRLEKAYQVAEGSYKQQIFDFLVTSPSPPSSIQKELLKMATKDNQLQTVFSLLSKSSNEEFKKSTAESLHRRFFSMSKVAKALSLKFFIFNRNLVHSDLIKETDAVAQESDDISQDAFLNAVDQLNLAPKYASQIQMIAKESPFYNLKLLAQTILQNQGIRP